MSTNDRLSVLHVVCVRCLSVCLRCLSVCLRCLSYHLPFSSSLSDEVDMLAEIYLDDLVLNDSNSLENIATRLELDLRPSTAQDVASQHVCLVLSISVPSEVS